MAKKLTIIIVTFNSEHIIRNCLSSFNVNDYEVVVVDNNSSDNTNKIIAEEFSSVKILAQEKNLGFGRANNIALRQCQTPFALILNPDALIRNQDLENAILQLENNPEIALASLKTLDTHNFDEAKTSSEIQITYQHFIVGGIMFINMKNLQKIGLFDEDFFMFTEDSDLCDRAINLGFQNAIFHNSFAIHLGGNSSKKTLKTIYRRFWHLGWSKSKYRRKRKNLFNFVRATIRLLLQYFFEGIFYFFLGKIEKSIGKFAFCFGCFANLIGLKAFDKNENPRGNLKLFS